LDGDKSVLKTALFRAPIMSGLSRVKNTRDDSRLVGMCPTASYPRVVELTTHL
jgi:hypothetical protein